MKRALLRFALAAACLASFPACRKAAPTSAALEPLRLSQRNEPADLDPATATLPDEFFVIRALGEGLLVPDPAGGAPLPGAAERFEVSPDGLAYTFHLRPAQWSNGEPVTAEDFAASYRRALTPATAAAKADLFFAVKNARAFATGQIADFSAVGFRAADAQTLVVTLERPAPRFPYYVASGQWIPVNPRVVARHGKQWTQPANHVGNGPYTLAEWRPQQRIAVRKNPRYREAARVRVPEIHFLRFDSSDTEDRAYRAGQVDVTMGMPYTKIDVYARERPAEFRQTPLADTRFLTFNTTRAPLSDARVRRALGLALDRARLVERVVRGGQQPAGRFVSPVLRSGAAGAAPLAAEFRLDPAAARELLAAAGFAGGQGFPRLSLMTWSPSQVPVLEATQAMWKQELGIEVAVTLHEAKVHLAALNRGDYDIAFATTILDVADPGAVLDDFTRAAANNFPHWRSAEYDALLASAAAQTTEAARAAILDRAEALLLAEAPVAPIYFNTKNWLIAPRVRGWQEDALWQRSYVGLSLDEK